MHGTNPHRVSVVIPAYNAARFLPEAIDSVLQQTHPVHEIIVVDDGSTDNTEHVVAALGSHVTYIHQPNGGVSAARNRGIKSASSDIIAFLDADDRWLPEKTARQLKIFADNPHAGLVATDRTDIDAHGQILLDSLFKKQGLYSLFVDLNGHPIPAALSRLVQVNFIPTSSAMVLKAALEKVGDFDTSIRYGEDLELWARLAAEYDIVCLPDVLIHYRQHGNNATQATEKLLLDMVRVMKNIRAWGAVALHKEGLNIDKVIARSLWELGYWYFTSPEPQRVPGRARALFLESFREDPSLRALSYAGLSLMPSCMINPLRRIKQKITDRP
jgi:glycosyltransferase involved in cell wall biosynthesis